MTHTAPRPFDDGDPDLVDDVDRCGLRVEPIAVARVSRLRSPIFGARPARAQQGDDVGPAPMTLPLEALIVPARIGLVVALPLLVLTTWQVAVAGALLLLAMRELQRLCDRLGITFGGGFLAYRPDTGWPHGVQEDDDVHWRWTRHETGRPARR